MSRYAVMFTPTAAGRYNDPMAKFWIPARVHLRKLGEALAGRVVAELSAPNAFGAEREETQ